MNLSFYTVNDNYCKFLCEFEPRLMSTADEKANRPFIGIVFSLNNFCYYAPLTSPKPKHIQMNNQVDFLKINSGIWGAINFNNMIPVPKEQLTKVSLRIDANSTKEERDYKNLLINQLSWCNSNREHILKQASRLYSLITDKKASPGLLKRCCNFPLVEQKCLEYILNS